MKKILIVEVDPCTRTIYCSKLEAEGFEVEGIEDGSIAIARLKLSSPDLVLLDLMLPEVSGLDVLKFIRGQASTEKLPVIVLSNGYERSLIETAQRAGANFCLSKATCNPRNLVGEVRTMLAAVERDAGLLAKTAPAATLADSVPPEKCAVEVMSDVRQGIQEMRHLFQSFGKSDETVRAAGWLEVRRAVHGVAGRSALAGLAQMAQMACALEALLNELHLRPEKLNPSSLRTVAQAIDLLVSLADNAGVPQSDTWKTPRILVVDDEPISRQTVCAALKRAGLSAIVLDDPFTALKLLEENRFDLIFLDVEMPGLNGFDVCKQLHATDANATTPVVFVTSLTNFETRTRSHLSGGTDLIAKPVVLMELAVKALIHLLRPRPPSPPAKVKNSSPALPLAASS